MWLSLTFQLCVPSSVDHTELFKQLTNLVGTLEDRQSTLDRVIYEAYRFKRLPLADRLMKYKECLTDPPLTNGSNSSSSLENTSTLSSKTASHTSKQLATTDSTQTHISKLESAGGLKPVSTVTVHKERVNNRS